MFYRYTIVIDNDDYRPAFLFETTERMTDEAVLEHFTATLGDFGFSLVDIFYVWGVVEVLDSPNPELEEEEEEEGPTESCFF